MNDLKYINITKNDYEEKDIEELVFLFQFSNIVNE